MPQPLRSTVGPPGLGGGGGGAQRGVGGGGGTLGGGFFLCGESAFLSIRPLETAALPVIRRPAFASHSLHDMRNTQRPPSLLVL